MLANLHIAKNKKESVQNYVLFYKWQRQVGEYFLATATVRIQFSH